MSELFHPGLMNFLPPESRRKVAALEAERDGRFGALRLFEDRLEAAFRHRDEVTAAAHSQRQRLDPGYRPDPAELERIEAPIKRAEAEISQLRSQRDSALERWHEFDILSGVAAWLADLRRVGIKLHHHALPPVKGDHRKLVEDARLKLNALADEWQKVEQAPRPIADARAAIVREIDAIAERGRPDLDLRLRDQSPINIRRAMGLVGEGNSAASFVHFAAWLHRDAIVERAISLLPKVDPAGALTDDQRDREFERISAARLEAERAEEAVIVAAAKEGMTIPRRPDADPRAILEVAEV